MDKDIGATWKVVNLANINDSYTPIAIGVIDGRSITSRDIVEESKPIQIVLGDLASIISLNVIRSL